MLIKHEEILIKNPKNKKTYCEIFSYQPENIEEISLGNLYVVSELTSEENSSRLTNLLNSVIKREFYFSPHRGSLTSMENSLKKVNYLLNEMANQDNLSWLGHLHFICAVFNKQDLYLSQAGQAQAWLCREGSLTNITKKIVPAPQKPHPAKIFQSVISGKVELDDKFIFGTPLFFNLFNDKGFEQILTLPKLEMIFHQISQVLHEQKKPPSLGALIIEMAPDEEEISKKNNNKFITPPIGLSEILNP